MRNSSKVKSYQGLDVKVKQQENQKVNTFGQGDGSQKAIPPDVADYIQNDIIPASVDTLTFNVIKSYFTSTGNNERYAIALSLLIIDSARIKKTSAMKLLDDVKRNKITFDNELLYLINMLDSVNSRLTIVEKKDNKNSFKSQYIRV